MPSSLLCKASVLCCCVKGAFCFQKHRSSRRERKTCPQRNHLPRSPYIKTVSLFAINISTNLNIQLGLQTLDISKIESFLEFTLATVKEAQTKQTNKNSMGEPWEHTCSGAAKGTLSLA